MGAARTEKWDPAAEKLGQTAEVTWLEFALAVVLVSAVWAALSLTQLLHRGVRAHRVQEPARAEEVAYLDLLVGATLQFATLAAAVALHAALIPIEPPWHC